MKDVYFHPDELRQGKAYSLSSEIRGEDGRIYDLEEWIARGGNAAVFRCRDRGSDEPRAIKFLLNFSRSCKVRFSREIDLLKAVGGDHFPQYYGSGLVRAQRIGPSRQPVKLRFLIMELADCNLDDLVRSQRPISYERYAGQFRGLATALAELHKSAVHRDIKPENIFVAGDRWLLGDYGLCSLVAAGGEDAAPLGMNMGPKFWLSPEAQNRRLGIDEPIAEDSDVFQLASVFWYVVNGRHPTGILQETDWTGPKKLFPVMEQALLHCRDKRPRNGDEFLRGLEEALAAQ